MISTRREKFTEGKWTLTKSSWAENSWDLNIGGSYSLATVITTPPEGGSSQEKEELEANAYLMVCAKDMYYTLDTILTVLEGRSEYNTDDISKTYIRKLLTKARGELIMKPFNLERALAGDPVVTRSGKEVTQLTKFDCNEGESIACVIKGLLQVIYIHQDHIMIMVMRV